MQMSCTSPTMKLPPAPMMLTLTSDTRFSPLLPLMDCVATQIDGALVPSHSGGAIHPCGAG